METNKELQRIWQQREVAAPNTQDLIEKANQFKGKELRKLVLAVLALVVSAIIITLVWIYYDSQLISTKLGMVLVLVALVTMVINQLKIMPMLHKQGFTMNSEQYLSQLTHLKARQQNMQTKTLNIYFLLLTLGLIIYMYEPASMMPLWLGVTSYVVTLGWLAFNWFFLRPRIIAKNNAKTKELISKFEEVNRQFEMK